MIERGVRAVATQRRSQTQVAVLGALSVAPMTGYALREAICDVLGHFWSESFGQIYPTLAALEDEGAVERQEASGSPSPRRGASVFAITPAGRAKLEALLAEPIQRTPPRNGLLLRLFFGRHLGSDACRSLVRDAREEAEGQLARLEAFRTEVDQDDANNADRPFWLSTISAGEHSARAAIAWADETLAALDDIAASTTRTEQ